jgi:lipid-A-disaccharide synthase
MHVFFSAGEPSGDQHAAHLLQALQERVPGARFSGFGGVHLEQAGAHVIFPLTDMAVMGFTAVLPLLRKFFRVAHMGREFLKEHRPDAVVLVDFPGFNWYIAKYAKELGIPVYFYCPPQMWAWGSWRIKWIKRYIDCVLSVLPFEAEWYKERGARVEYVGHPFFDQVERKQLDEEFCRSLRQNGERLVALLPGSRRSEVTRNFDAMLEMARNLHRDHPDVRFPVACYKEYQRDWCVERYQQLGETLPIDFYVGRTSEIIATMDCCAMVSGSVSLEVLARGKPAVVCYRPTAMNYLYGKMLIHIKYMSLPNLMLNRELMPEVLYVFDVPKHAARMQSAIDRWLSNPQEMQAMKREMGALREQVMHTDGSAKAADAILKLLGEKQVSRAAA